MTDAEHDYRVALVLYYYWQRDLSYMQIAEYVNLDHNQVREIVKVYPSQDYDPRAIPPVAPPSVPR